MNKNDDFWKIYWNESEMLNNSNPQLQIGRSINKIPVDELVWKKTLEQINKYLLPEKNDKLLDLCAGNGLLSEYFSKKVNNVLALDISSKLISEIDKKSIKNINTEVVDIRSIRKYNNVYNKALLYFALQHFSESEVVVIFDSVFHSLSVGGRFYIGDIPDEGRKWQFYNTKDREKAYFDALRISEPIIGNWFTKSFICKLSRYIGFSVCEIIEQKEYMINSHYRFDALLIK